MAEIMIADDSISIRTPLRVILENYGHQVYDFDDGKQATDFAADKKVDLVITDLNMPVMTGMMLIARLRKNPLYQSVPI